MALPSAVEQFLRTLDLLSRVFCRGLRDKVAPQDRIHYFLAHHKNSLQIMATVLIVQHSVDRSEWAENAQKLARCIRPLPLTSVRCSGVPELARATPNGPLSLDNSHTQLFWILFSNGLSM